MVLLSLGAIATAQAQSFDNLWKEVKRAEQKSLPQTVIQLTGEIYRKAETEKNSPQMLKAYIWRMKYRDRLTPDSIYASLQGLEQWAQTTKVPMDRAILHSLIGEIYADYAGANSWQLRQRTDIVDETPPTDIREWSANQFVQQVMKQVDESLQDSLLLLNTSSRTYVPFVELGETSEYYHHDMYHLLASRAINDLEQVKSLSNGSLVDKKIEQLYEQMINTYQRKSDQDAIVLTMLDFLKWKKNNDLAFSPVFVQKGGNRGSLDPYLMGLDGLIEKYKSCDVCAEVYLAKAEAAVENKAPSDALRICDEAIVNYLGYRRINALKNLKQDILNPDLSVELFRIVYPNQELKMKVTHKNLDGFTLNVYKIASTPQTIVERSEMEAATAIRKYGKRVSSEHKTLIRTKNYLSEDTMMTFKAPEVGLYVVQIVPDAKNGKAVERWMSSSNLKALTCSLPDKQYEFVVLDAKNGHPVADATVTISRKKNTDLKLTTDANGKIQIPWQKEFYSFTVMKGSDIALPSQYIRSGFYEYDTNQKPTVEMTLLTDRSLYRPGQTVYVKGIAYEKGADSAHVVVDKTYTLTLTDSNGQEVGKKEVRTNDFGSFTAEFTLPSACLNGAFYLRTEVAFLSIRVEEYKRPTFDITFDKPDKSYRIGDYVQLYGQVQTFSGVPLQDLPVRYTVTRYSRLGWRMVRMSGTLLESDTVSLDNDGRFTIPVRLKGEADVDSEAEPYTYYTYSIEAVVTNVAGETQSSVFELSVGNRSIILGVDPEVQLYNKDDATPLVFKAVNLNGQPVKVNGSYELVRTAADGEEVTVAKGAFTSNVKTALNDWKQIPSGEYELYLSAKDDQGREVEYDQEITLFSLDDKRPVTDVPIWYYPINTKFDATHPAEFVFGTSFKDTYVLMKIFSGDKQVSDSVVHLSDSLVRFRYPYKDEYGNGLKILFCFVKDGKLYQQQVGIEKRLPDNQLTMKWDVFRDKLRPGQEEEWKLTIKTPQGVPAVAEMLATMYDASLDKIWKMNQTLKLYYQIQLPYVSWNTNYNENLYYNIWFKQKRLDVPELSYDTFANLSVVRFMLSSSSRGLAIRGASTRLYGMVKAEADNAFVAKEVDPEEQIIFPSASQTEEGSQQDDESDQKPDLSAVRTNFAETAFFYPQLRTNEQGEISFSFTMPQSLTSWNFRGYSHTKEMLTGMLDAQATTSKEFMLTPNLPRFVRVGDKVSIAASVTNLTEKNINGTVSLTLFNPVTEKNVSVQKQKFAVEAGKTIGVNFLFTVSGKEEVLGCRLIADGGTFSDGEQQLIPVLSNKINLTETLALSIRGQQTKTFSLANLFNHNSKSAADRRLTIEFTGNPAWYAVQSLPSLSQPQNDNAISWATAYYANSLASFIMNTQPRIKAIFDTWKLQGGNKETFLSNLQKNQDVKNILLSESPWVLEATTETEQKERIATLFDLNTIRNNDIAALTKLKELQLADGSWTWYKGMNGSRYVTDFIVEMNARLSLLTGKPLEGAALTMQNAAFTFLHKEALKEYKEILKAKKEGYNPSGLSNSALKYLYLVAISDTKVPAANKDAYHYFLSKVNEILTTQSVTDKAMAAIILNKAGRKTEANEFMASLKQHLVQTEEQGMYFAFNESPYTWGGLQIPAHVDVMEAFDLVSNDSSVVNEMKIWLLKQKQTMQWNSPVATADAVYALLYRGTDLLDSQGDVRITVANKVLETLSPSKTTTPGLGYVKETFTEKNVVNAKNITVDNRDSGIGWGAVYAQYEESFDQLRQQGGELNVDKKLYVERTVGNKRELQPLTEKTQLAVGDKVVSRLTIRLDRAMDFIQLKDQRAACFEPIGTLSGYIWKNGFGYYVDVKDASTNFFFDGLGKGVYVLEYSYRVSRTGVYENGVATIQSAYAPEYASHSASVKVIVK